MVCIVYLCGHSRESSCCINTLNTVIVLAAAGGGAGIVLFTVVLTYQVIGKSGASVPNISDDIDLRCTPDDNDLPIIIAAGVSYALLILFIVTYAGACCYIKITGKKPSDRHYCCPQISNCPGDGFGEEDQDSD